MVPSLEKEHPAWNLRLPPLYTPIWCDEVQYDMSTFRIHDRIWKPPTLQNRFHIVFYQMGSQQTPGFGKVWILHYIGKVWACGFEILAWLIVCSAFEAVPRVVSEIQPAESFNAIANENPSQKCLCNFNAAFFYRFGKNQNDLQVDCIISNDCLTSKTNILQPVCMQTALYEWDFFLYVSFLSLSF